MSATDFSELLKAVNSMDDLRFWALWATGSLCAVGWVTAKVILALKSVSNSADGEPPRRINS